MYKHKTKKKKEFVKKKIFEFNDIDQQQLIQCLILTITIILKIISEICIT